MESINDQYDNLINAADKFGAAMVEEEKGQTIPEYVEKFAKAIDEEARKDPTLAFLESLPSNGGNLNTDINEDMKPEEVNTQLDMVTGAVNVLNNDTVKDKPASDFNIDEYIDMSLYEVDRYPVEKLDLESFYKDFKITSSKDKKMIMNIFKSIQSGKDFNIYGNIPSGAIKEMVNKTCGVSGAVTYQQRAAIAKDMFTEILKNSIDSQAITDLGSIMDQVKIDSGKKVDSIIYFAALEKLPEYIDGKIEDADTSEKKLTWNCMKEGIEESISLKDFLHSIECGKVKIKRYEYNERFLNIFKEFNFKYERSKINIYDVRELLVNVPRVLKYYFPERLFTDSQIKAFIVAFCKYTRNFSIHNTKQHSFMYYFIYNIGMLATSDPSESDSDICRSIADNILKCISAISCRIDTRDLL